MTPDEYLRQILNQQRLDDSSGEITELQRHRRDVETLLAEKYPDADPVVRYGGSRAKGTMNRESYDLDLIWYLRNGDNGAGETLEEIFHNVATALSEKYDVQMKSSAIRLRSKERQNKGADFHIDVVPGRFTNDDEQDVYLHVSDGDKDRLKTNLQKHIDHIRESGVVDTIRLAKLWNVRFGLRIKTFVLELLVVKALDGSSDSRIGLSSALTKFWNYLVDHRNSLTVEDPANPYGNDLSGVLASFKQRLCDGAEDALKLIEESGWEALFGPVQEANAAKIIAAIGQAAAVITTPAKPWADTKYGI